MINRYYYSAANRTNSSVKQLDQYRLFSEGLEGTMDNLDGYSHLVVGLGNPRIEHEQSKHNVGKIMVD